MHLAMPTPAVLKAPLRLDLPDLPTEPFWSSKQWEVFMAIMDIVVPAIVPKSRLVDKQAHLAIPDLQYAALIKASQDTVLETRDEEALRAFLEDRPSTNPIFREMLLRTLYRLPAKQRTGLGVILSVLSCVTTSTVSSVAIQPCSYPHSDI